MRPVCRSLACLEATFSRESFLDVHPRSLKTQASADAAMEALLKEVGLIVRSSMSDHATYLLPLTKP